MMKKRFRRCAMQVTFENQSSQAIRLTMHGNSHVLPSGKKAVLDIDCREPIFARVDQYKPLQKKDTSYRLVVETQYRLEGLTEGCRILLTRERIAIDVNMSYDRVFLHPTAGQIAEETYQVVNHPNVHKQLRKDQRSDAFWWPIGGMIFDVLWDLLFHPIRTLLGIAIAIGVGIYFGWYWIPIFFLGWLLVLGLINMVIDPLIDKLIAKITRIPTEREQLKKYCTPEALSAYYSQPEREDFWGKPVEH